MGPGSRDMTGLPLQHPLLRSLEPHWTSAGRYDDPLVTWVSQAGLYLGPILVCLKATLGSHGFCRWPTSCPHRRHQLKSTAKWDLIYTQ